MTNLRLVAYLTILLTASCASNSEETKTDVCDHLGIITVAPDDHLTIRTERMILMDDEAIKDDCGLPFIL